jgi:hypothetical protein
LNAAGNFAARLIDHPAGRDLNQPPAGIVGKAFLRPLRERRKRCLLHSVFGRGEVAKTP